MNEWLRHSIEYANQYAYLDDLFRVYPTIPEGIRNLNPDLWENVEKAYEDANREELIRSLLRMELFPIKDSYVAYLKRDPEALARNPRTTNRLCGRLYEMGLQKIFERCSEPKETNRQIGPMFRLWVNRGSLGMPSVQVDDFLSTNDDAILNAGDMALMNFAREHLAYNGTKGLDLVCRIAGHYVVGEAKFLTDFGGHQNAQLSDAMRLLSPATTVNAIRVAILDGVIYIPGQHKMARELQSLPHGVYVMSALVLREFLYQL